jgi:hypothetical protein
MNSEGLDALIITFAGLMALAFGCFVVAIVQDCTRPIKAPETLDGEGSENAHNTSNRPMTPDLVWSK